MNQNKKDDGHGASEHSDRSTSNSQLASHRAIMAAFNQYQSPLKENLDRVAQQYTLNLARQTSQIIGRGYADRFAAQYSQFLKDLNPASRQIIQSLQSNRAFQNWSQATPEKSRKSKAPRDFIAIHAKEVHNPKGLIKAISKISSKHIAHNLVWRGQGNANWPIHSTLYRAITESYPGNTVSEEDLIRSETDILNEAMDWGLPAHEMSLSPLLALAELQHAGAPTRLLDVTQAPEVAAWFAVENPGHDEHDGIIVAWGQRARIKKGTTGGPPTSDILNANQDRLPWHDWDHNERLERGWGTGSKTYTWFPQAPNTRMRVQRGGFMIESGPILLESVVETINAELSASTGLEQDWRQAELESASSIVGLPSPGDRKTTPNQLAIVPMFAIVVRADAKKSIRNYLATRGIESRTMYPDLAGMVAGLRRQHP